MTACGASRSPMPTGMSLRSFGSATSRGYRGVWQANYGLKLTRDLPSIKLTLPPNHRRCRLLRAGPKKVHRYSVEVQAVADAACVAPSSNTPDMLGRRALPLDLIRFGGHLPKGGYDVRNGRDTQPTAPSAIYG